MPESRPCPLSTHTALLRPIARWSLDTFGGDPPMLVGVSLANPKALFHPISLDPFDPVTSIDQLVAPTSWDLVVVIVEALETGSEVRDGIVAHAVDRAGRSATELDDWCGRRRALRSRHGRLHKAAVQLLNAKHC